ncbi:UNVERIFIED_ORG: Ca2+-binding RTX toxin-like protein, partial [Rhizobium esperanzae]
TGADHLAGGLGNDTYIVDNAGDVVTENVGEGTDTVRTALASYTLAANVENLVYTGAAAFAGTGNGLDNMITGGAGADTLTGGAGNDTLDGGVGADHLIGGTGDDIYIVDNASDVVTENAGEGTDTIRTNLATYSLASLTNVENLTYTGTAAFTGTGNASANVITGGSGNDTLDGGAGADTLIGGTGDDTYVVDNASDIVVENIGEGMDTIKTALTAYSLGTNVENLTFTGTASFTGTGNGLDNIMTGGTGADHLIGGLGNDTYVVDNAGDVVTENAGEGTDTVKTALAAYTLGANVENLVSTGTAAFAGTGNELANAITGGVGADTLDGGAGSDTLSGGAGNDIYVVDNIGDVVVEAAGAGTDTIKTVLNSYSLASLANVENLTFTGTGDFSGAGNAAVNVITGGAGNDILDGGAGADTLVGGAGNDIYIVDNTGDVVTEAASAGTDTIETALASYSLAALANVENLTYTGTTAFTGTGNTLANVISGGSGNDTLDGGAGADTL